MPNIGPGFDEEDCTLEKLAEALNMARATEVLARPIILGSIVLR
jgi:hypothetical protein